MNVIGYQSVLTLLIRLEYLNEHDRLRQGLDYIVY